MTARALVLGLILAAAAGAEEARPPYLGARLADADGGVRIEGVVPDAPAAAAGLRAGDVVVRFAGTEVANAGALLARLREARPGQTVELTFRRDGREATAAVKLAVHPQTLLERPDDSPGLHAVAVERDLSYAFGDAAAHERRKLNLFLPKIEGAFPIVLWIHAGAWSYGDRARETALAMRFAERGVGFAPMSYRLSSRVWNEPGASTDGVKHPAHAEDCALAFAWLKKRFPDHPLFLAGHSCGAHLAALLGTDARYLKAHGLALTDIGGVIALGGGYDLVEYHALLAHGLDGQPGLGQEKADAHLHWIFGATKREWIAASPTTYLAGCETPMLIVAEKGAAMTRYTRDFEDAVIAAGVKTIRFRYALDRSHDQTTPLMSRKAPDPIRDEAIAFIRAHAR